MAGEWMTAFFSALASSVGKTPEAAATVKESVYTTVSISQQTSLYDVFPFLSIVLRALLTIVVLVASASVIKATWQYSTRILYWMFLVGSLLSGILAVEYAMSSNVGKGVTLDTMIQASRPLITNSICFVLSTFMGYSSSAFCV